MALLRLAVSAEDSVNDFLTYSSAQKIHLARAEAAHGLAAAPQTDFAGH